MESQIWKYNFPANRKIEIEMPIDAQIISVQNQNETGTLWAIVNPAHVKVKRTFTIIGTGASFDVQDKKYIGTFQSDGGMLVWHLFEIVAEGINN